MLQSITENIWYVQHRFVVSSVPITSRMTIVRLSGGDLWLHSPVPISAELKAEIDALGAVKFIVAPSRVHHLFAGDVAALYPNATLFGVPGLAKKRPDLHALQMLQAEPGSWAPELSYILFQGIPFANETIWFHEPSKTLIITDLCQWWVGDIGWKASLWNHLMDARRELNVPRTVRHLVRDPEAARASAKRILEWPIERVVLAHNSIVEQDAKKKLTHAFRHFL